MDEQDKWYELRTRNNIRAQHSKNKTENFIKKKHII